MRLGLHNHDIIPKQNKNTVTVSQCDCRILIRAMLQTEMASPTHSRSESYQSTMRFSTLALFIVLPAAAYAAATLPRVNTLESSQSCNSQDEPCGGGFADCCVGYHCEYRTAFTSGVRPSASSHVLADQKC